MRTSFLITAVVPLLFALGCKPDETGTSGTDGTDETDDTNNPAYGDCHPLLAEYLIAQGKDPLDSADNSLCFTLNVNEPCTRRGGREGTRVFRFMDDGRVTADGKFTGTEYWFWFEGDPDNWDQDVVDTLTYEGAASERFTGSQLTCSQCEEIYEVTRTVVENNSGTPYATDVVFALDNLNPNGGFQDDTKRNMFVFYGRYNRQGEINDLDTDYAKGQYTPDSMVPGTLPASYTWFPQGGEGKCY